MDIEDSYNNLSAEAQALLLCLAPFTGVLKASWLEQYMARLKGQPALAELPYERWPEVQQEAVKAGWLQPHEQLGQVGYEQVQPTFLAFLKTRLHDPAQATQKEAIETAFRHHYQEIGGVLGQHIQSKQAQERQLGQAFISVEYENLLAAMDLSILAQTPFHLTYEALFRYLLSQQQHQAAIDLSKKVLAAQANYRADQIEGEIGQHFYLVLARLANSYLELKNYPAAEEVYRNSLGIVQNLKSVAPATRANYIAIIFHQLGIVAQVQRQWAAAERSYQAALETYRDLNDRYEQAGTLHQLGMVAQEQQQWAAAEQFYQEALQIKIEFNDRYAQASTLQQLGLLAQEQGQWAAAEVFYQKSLQIKIEFNDRYKQASTLHQLGLLAQEQGQWAAAEQFYQETLQIYLDFNDRYEQAGTLHNLGKVAQAQQQWAAAERFYQAALQIKIEFNDSYAQASTLGQLGLVAEAQGQWAQAVDYTLQAASILAGYNDPQLAVALTTLARLRRAGGQTHIAGPLAEKLGISVAESEALLARFEETEAK